MSETSAQKKPTASLGMAPNTISRFLPGWGTSHAAESSHNYQLSGTTCLAISTPFAQE